MLATLVQTASKAASPNATWVKLPHTENGCFVPRSMSMLAYYLLLPIISLLLTAAGVWALIPLARGIGWVDHPDVRKVHESPTPVVGGVAIFLGICAALIMQLTLKLPVEPWWLWACASLMLFIGLMDDVSTLGPRLRILLQVAVCLLMVVPAGVVLTHFGPLFGPGVLELGVISVPITVFAALGVINAFNMIDGMDGVGGSIFIVAAAGMGFFAFTEGQLSLAWTLMFVSAAVMGFMVFNVRFPWNPKAKVFMGNSGSMMLGFLLAWFLISLGNGESAVFMPMTAVWLFAVPLLDTSTLIWTRWRQGQSAFNADNQHIHHAFLRAGFSQEVTWIAISFLAIILAATGIAIELSDLPGYFSFYIFMVFALTYYFYLRHCWSSQQFLGRHFIHHDFTIEESLAR